MLDLAATLDERASSTDAALTWWARCAAPLDRLAEHLLRLRAAAESELGLLAGSPEADERERVRRYFHNNAWVARGLARWAEVCRRRNLPCRTPPARTRGTAAALGRDTLEAIGKTWPVDESDWWLPPHAEPVAPRDRPVGGVTRTRLGSYTNYRYWPELLSSGLLGEDLAARLVGARLRGGGQFCGMTRFMGWLDDWPLADYLVGLWRMGRKDDYVLSLYGHLAYHQARGHLTAYEQVTFPPGRKRADYCLPSQLVAARVTRRLVP